MQIINPATDKLIKSIDEDTEKVVQTKYQLLREGQLKWKDTDIFDRIAAVKKFSELLRENVDSLAEILTAEMGKPLSQSRDEIKGACKKIKFFTLESERYLSGKNVNVDGNTHERIVYDPLGIIGNISAWTFPYLVGVGVFIPALIAGNAVLYKPSEHTTLTGLEIEKYLTLAGVPNDVFQTVVGGANAGRYLLDLPLDGYFFTGSNKTGRYIAQRVADKLVPVVLELGGVDPVYICDDVKSLKETAAAVSEGCFYNNGQSCCATERIYVHKDIYHDFVDLLADETNKLVVGDPLESKTNQGPLARKIQKGFLNDQIADARGKGGRVVTGGNPVGEVGAFFEPTIIADANHDMKVMKEETFGPVKAVMKVQDDEQAIALMNDSDFGLTASVFSSDHNRAKLILDRVDSGTSYINCLDRVSAYLPWSGRKGSGIGSTHSFHGIYAFCKPRGIHERMLN